MNVYIARQPIFDKYSNLHSYELLYRDGEENAFNCSMDGSRATRFLISDAITVFGINKLTNDNLAFINFTREVLLSDFVFLANPKEVVIEILEDVIIDSILIERIIKLKELGYKIALDDYVGDSSFDSVLPYIDILKVNFMLVDLGKAKRIARRYAKTGISLLAEKVETYEVYEQAVKFGYTLFQGYYFAKPHVVSKESGDIAKSSFIRILQELRTEDPDYSNISDIIEQDAGLTYKLLRHINTMKYAHTSFTQIKSVRMAVVRLGVDEFRRWVLLTMARDYTKEQSEELIRTAFIRAIFAEKLARASVELMSRSGDAFMMGMFSLIDTIIGGSISELLNELPLADDVKSALLGEENKFYHLLEFVKLYENANWIEVEHKEELHIYDIDNLAEIYFECIIYADGIFEMTK